MSISNARSKQFKLNQLNFFAIPLMAFAGLATLGIFAINQDVDPSASASNSTAITGTISYEDEYITISNNAKVDLGTMNVTADSTYAYATDNVTVSTNVPTGYDLYLSSADNSSSALTTPSSYTQIAATSGTGGDGGTPKVLDADSYGYAISKDIMTGDGLTSNFDSSYATPNSSSKWAGVPAGTQDRLRSTSTATSDSGDTTEVHYGANVTNYLAPGTYSGSVVYSAVVTPSNNTVEMSVSPNSGAVGTVLTIVSGPADTISTSHQLDPSEVDVIFQQNGITKGHCDVTEVDPSSGHLVTLCKAPNLTPSTYDISIVIPRFGFSDIITNSYRTDIMQDMNSSTCKVLNMFDNTNADTASSTTYTVIDNRDSNRYYIRKLADGNCWMAQNLRLIGARTLTPNNTNITSDFSLPSSAAWTDTSNFGNHLISANNAQVLNDTITSSARSARGTYYTWIAAIASTSGVDAGKTATTSVCPKHWSLPTGDGATRGGDVTIDQFANLYSTYSSDYNLLMSAFDYYYSNSYDKSYYLAGYFDTTGYVSYVYSSSSEGRWWNSTYQSTNNGSAGAALVSDSTYYNTITSLPGHCGLNVRCVLAGS